MRTAIVTAVLLIATTTARAESAAYVDLDQAANECMDGKKLDADLKDLRAAYDKSVAQAKAAKKSGPELPTLTAQEKAKRDEAAGRIYPRLGRILMKMVKARRLDVLRSKAGLVYVDPKLDLTAELVKRYDAGEENDPSASAAEIKALRDRLATLEAQRHPETKAPAKPGAK